MKFSKLKLLPPAMACLPVPERWQKQPGWNAGAARAHLQFASEAVTEPERLEHLARAAEFERLEELTRKMGVCT